MNYEITNERKGFWLSFVTLIYAGFLLIGSFFAFLLLPIRKLRSKK